MQELNDGLIKIDKIEADKDFEKKFLKKLEYLLLNVHTANLDENDISYICSFDGKKMFKMIKNIGFRNAFVKAGEQELIDENLFLEKLDILFDYYKNNNMEWKDYDDLGFFGSSILLSKCSYIIKETSISFVNMAIDANRYGFIDMVKREILDNIDPTLESKINKLQ